MLILIPRELEGVVGEKGSVDVIQDGEDLCEYFVACRRKSHC